jgi:YhcN/YlaJ family sporulation lipoprotein
MVVCVILLLAVFTGCNQSSKNPNGQVQVKQSAPQKKEITDPQAVARHLEQLAASVPQVESANCVVFGNTAIVGINVAPEVDRARVGTIKYSVAEALRKDPYGADAIVTADMDLAQRIKNIRDQIMNGNPINGFAQELGVIIGRIVPQFPRATEPTPPDSKMNQNL